MRVLLAVGGILLAAALLVSEAAMQPSARGRLALYGVFGVTAIVTAAGAWVVLRLMRRSKSVRNSVLVVALAAVLAATAVVAASAVSMFLSPHDLRLVLVALAFGMGLGSILAATMSGPLVSDLQRLAGVAGRVAGGDLGVRTFMDRADEVGSVAQSMDAMIEELERARTARREFLAAIGHDLRTPLTALQAAVEALQDGMAPDPDRYLRSMAHDLAVMRALVDDLFLLARIEAHELRLRPITVDLTELVDEVCEAMRPVAERGRVRLALEADRPVRVMGDPEALGRVTRNLIDNAMRQAPQGSTVRIAVALEDGGGGLVRVLDEGPGFPEGFVERALESFTRADLARAREDGGAGLGLAIARGFIQAHGGDVWVQPGPGGKVAFRLPGQAPEVLAPQPGSRRR